MFSRFETLSASSTLDLKSNRLSSANKRWFTAGAVGATLILVSEDDCELDFRRHERPSAAIKK